MSQSLIEENKIQFLEKDFINFLRNQGIIVNTNTKARGNLGFYLKNRIDISINVPKHQRISILAHEYAHKIHYDIDKDNFRAGGCLKKIFDTNDIDIIKKELIDITNFVDKTSLLNEYKAQKINLKSKIKELETLLKEIHPSFRRSYTFKPVNSYFRKNKSPARYLLKHDHIKIKSSFLFIKKEELYSIKNIDRDFPEIPKDIRIYIKLKSLERKYKKACRNFNNINRYYNKPTELFARFVQGLFIDKAAVFQLAPVCFNRFHYLLEQGYYGKLKDLLILANI